MPPPEPLQGKSIVITGVTGQVAEPVAMALARDNQVVGAARFKDQVARERLEAAGIRCVPIDLVSGDVGGLPADADYVINFAVAKTNDWDLDLQANSGGLAWLMEHHQNATAFVHCSRISAAVAIGCQYRRMSVPIGVPGPTRVRRSFSSTVSMLPVYRGGLGSR